MLHSKVVHPRGPGWEAAFRLHLYVVMMSLPAAFVAYAAANTLIALLVLNIVALVLFGCVPAIAGWVWLSICSAIRSANRKTLATN
jgi:hypothetical protein